MPDKPIVIEIKSLEEYIADVEKESGPIQSDLLKQQLYKNYVLFQKERLKKQRQYQNRIKKIADYKKELDEVKAELETLRKQLEEKKSDSKTVKPVASFYRPPEPVSQQPSFAGKVIQNSKLPKPS